MFFKNKPLKIILLNQKSYLKKISPSSSIMTKNNRGFSLVEMMVVIGLLGGISLLVMNLTKQSTQSSTKYQFDSEIMLITNEINGILSDPDKCLTTFTNATQAASPAKPVLNATPANVLNPTGIAGIPSSDRKYTLSGGPYGNGGVKIASYSLNLAATPDPLLTINFQKKAILGTGTTPKTIKLDVEKTSAGVITRCKSISTASTEIWNYGGGSDIFYVGGFVGIGTTTPDAKLDVAGPIRSGNQTVGAACAADLKGSMGFDNLKNISLICDGTVWRVQSLSKMKTVTYTQSMPIGGASGPMSITCPNGGLVTACMNYLVPSGAAVCIPTQNSGICSAIAGCSLAPAGQYWYLVTTCLEPDI